MAGLYIHIPFCASRCIYCGFYSTTHLDLRQRYVDAVCREMETHPFPLPEGMGIDTVYLGGGTPSQLTIPQLRQLFTYINKVYSLPSIQGGAGGGSEVTIEVNPDDVTAEYAEALSRLGINRVSMGAQTFDDARLRFLHRRHTAAQVPVAVQRLRDAGIHNISIDLMYGFPNETLADWQHDIDAVLALNVEHLSAYCLMIEEGTPYEISNFARSGFRSRHNSSYWHDIPYIGLGAAAHSYTIPDGFAIGSSPVRSWNTADIHEYISAINEGNIPCEREVLDPDTHYNDRITTALRTSDGLDLTTLMEGHRRHCLHEAEPFLKNDLLKLTGSRLVLTRRGLFVSDMVMSQLMMV